MKIAVFTPSFLPKCSGAEIFHHNLASKLVEAGHEPVLIISRRNVEALRRKNWTLPYEILPFPANLWSLFKRSPWLTYLISDFLLSRLQAKHHFDVWHIVMTYPTGVAALHWNGGRSRVPCVLRVAGDDLLTDPEKRVGLRQNPLIDRLIAEELPKAATVISLSETISAEYRQLEIPEERIVWIPNAVDLTRFQKAVIRQTEVFTFLSVGRNHLQKDYPTLLKAAGLLSKSGKRFRLLIVGRDTASLQSLIDAESLGSVVATREVSPEPGSLEFPPEALIDLYLGADAFVMSSLMEGFSTALLEAMAAGLPVLSTDAPGCREFIRDGADGLMVPRGDAVALADGMLRLLESDDLRAELTKKSKLRAAEFSWPAIVSRYLALYEKLIRYRSRRLRGNGC